MSVCASLRLPIAALFTSASTRPKRSTASVATRVAVSTSPRSAAHIAESGAVLAALGEHGLEPVGAPGDDADGRAACRELRRERGADARRRAGDEDDGAVEVHGFLLLSA